MTQATRITLLAVSVTCIISSACFAQTAKRVRSSVAKVDSVATFMLDTKKNPVPGVKTVTYFSFKAHTNGKDTLVKFYELNDKFFSKRKVGDKYTVYYDTTSPYKTAQMYAVLPVFENGAVDTAVAIVKPNRGTGFTVEYTPKGAATPHKINVPYFKSTDGGGADLFRNYPEFTVKRTLRVAYQSTDPDKVYMLFTHAPDSATVRYHPHHNFITVNITPIVMTQIGYEHVFFKHFSLGADWGYYYPKSVNGYIIYGFDNGEGQGQYNDISRSYFNIGSANKFSGNFKFVEDFGLGTLFAKLFCSYIIAKDVPQIYYNDPHAVNPTNAIDSSVTQFLAENSYNKIYTRNTSFNAWGWGIGLGGSYSIDRYGRFMLGLEWGFSNAKMPDYAKQNIFVNGQEYYYMFTPAWEARINFLPQYGRLTFTFRF